MAGPGFMYGHGASAAQLPTTLGQTTSAASLSVVIASDYSLPVSLSSDVNTPVYVRATDGSAAYDLPQRAQVPSTLGQKAMAASLAVVIASDQSAIPASQSGTWNVTNISGTVSLPTGAATSLKQDTGNTSLASIDGKLALDTGASSGAVRVVIATRQEAAATPLSSRLSDGSAFYIGAKTGQLPTALGQTTAAASLSVVLASDQAAVPVSQSGTWNVTNISGTVSLPTGAATETTLAAASAKLPATLGQKTSANSMAVVVASDQSALTINQGGKVAAYQIRNDYTSTSVTTSAYVQLSASTSAAATRFRIWDSSGSALIFATGAAASETPVLYIPPGGFDAPVELTVASGTRLSVKALDTSATTGQLIISAFV